MKTSIPLDTIRISSPCDQSWDAMQGNERVRLCDNCHLAVHDLSQMRRADAQQLIDEADNRLCVRYTPDAEGKVLTLDYQPKPGRCRSTRFWIVSATIGAVIASVFRMYDANKPRNSGVP